MRQPGLTPDAVQAADTAVQIVCDDWGWRYASRQAWALSGVSLRILPGERVLLLGASGSGKSTLLQSIAGVLVEAEGGESTGRIELSIPSVESRETEPTAPRVGMVLQDPEAQVLMARVGDDVAFGCENLGFNPAEIHDRVQDALAAVALDVPGDTDTATLSGGQKQRLALAGVVAMRPGLMLLDEPTAMLDPQGVRELRESVATLTRERHTTLIVVEHRVGVWRDLIDRVIVLGQQGSVVADGPPDTVFREHQQLLDEMGVWLPSTELRVRSNQSHAPAEILLSAEGLEPGWPGHTPLLDATELSVRAGRVVAVTGANGTGKSTLALTLAGLLPPQGGVVDAGPIAGSLAADPQQWRSAELVSRIGVVFQSPDHQFVTHTVADELALGLRHAGLTQEERTERVAELSQQLGFEHLLQANPFTLSGGEKRRLSVACALAARPRVVILDEPTFGQDARTWNALVDILVGLRDEGCGILIVTHDQLLVDTLADETRELHASERSAGGMQQDARPGVTADVTWGMTSGVSAGVPLGVTSGVPETKLDRVNPLAKIGAAAVISFALILSLDWVSASVALALELLVLFASGLGARRLARVTAPLLLAAVLTAITIALYGRTSGAVYFEFFLIRVSEGSLALAGATFLRVLAIALPAVVLLTTIRPIDLADALEQHTPLPPRFILGALVALRQLDTFRSDWQTLTRSRRARGTGDRPAILRFWSQAFALFVLAIRRADLLAIAMHVRGFAEDAARTWTRVSLFTRRDWLFLVGALALVALAIALSSAMGTWSFVLGGVAA